LFRKSGAERSAPQNEVDTFVDMVNDTAALSAQRRSTMSLTSTMRRRWALSAAVPEHKAA